MNSGARMNRRMLKDGPAIPGRGLIATTGQTRPEAALPPQANTIVWVQFVPCP
jgi:hypothetical protein